MNVRAEALEMERSLYTRGSRSPSAMHARTSSTTSSSRTRTPGSASSPRARPTTTCARSFLELGLDDAALRRYGIRILKMGMLFPMEPTVVREFARGLEEIFVIEEKRPFLEMFAKNVLYGQANAPRIVGKFDEEERELLPDYGEFESDVIGRALTKRLSQKARIESAEAWLERLDEIHARGKLATATRTAWYCSGCPHNSSTQAVEGSLVSAGIGCHTMAMWMGRNVVMGTHMGAEGAQWIGMAPFTDTKHIFQNMGDGTYCPFGQPRDPLLPRATNANITFKLLLNMHTSMTGGQAITGAAAGRRHRVRLLAERRQEGDRHDRQPEQATGASSLAGGTEVWHRDRLDEAQRALAATPGHDRADPRPGMRGRAAPRAQPRQGRGAGRGHRHQRARLRRLRRLRREVQLHERRAGGDRVRPQDAHPPDLLQQGLLLRQGLLPVVPDHHAQPRTGLRATRRRRRRRAASPRSTGRCPIRCPRSTRASASACTSWASAAPAR